MKEESSQLIEKREKSVAIRKEMEEMQEILKYLGGVETSNNKLKQIQSRWDNLETIQFKYDQDIKDYQVNFKNTILQRQ